MRRRLWTSLDVFAIVEYRSKKGKCSEVEL